MDNTTDENNIGEYIFYVLMGVSALITLANIAYFIWAKLYKRKTLSRNTRRVSINISKPPPVVLTETQFDMLPRRVLQTPKDSKPQELESCSVCLSDICYGDELVCLSPCNHSYHVDCIRQWLTEKSTLCPLCKGDVRIALGIDVITPGQMEEGDNTVALACPPRAFLRRNVRSLPNARIGVR